MGPKRNLYVSYWLLVRCTAISAMRSIWWRYRELPGTNCKYFNMQHQNKKRAGASGGGIPAEGVAAPLSKLQDILLLLRGTFTDKTKQSLIRRLGKGFFLELRHWIVGLGVRNLPNFVPLWWNHKFQKCIETSLRIHQPPIRRTSQAAA